MIRREGAHRSSALQMPPLGLQAAVKPFSWVTDDQHLMEIRPVISRRTLIKIAAHFALSWF
ncbi:hypothetical protein C2857_006782 [Epichloe festucae Fl1]|uniref:Uncharacterized protein n=1 Tax=Epichloe festucae (strain Fl1) TaxID=877507 RepID=A0A7S9PST4_EPIFF|nr:hypothetical protein C2857_006782 [Epichloe festucae Fl1]